MSTGVARASVDRHRLAVVRWLAATLKQSPVAAFGHDGEPRLLSGLQRLLYLRFRVLGSQGSASCWTYPTVRRNSSTLNLWAVEVEASVAAPPSGRRTPCRTEWLCGVPPDDYARNGTSAVSGRPPRMTGLAWPRVRGFELQFPADEIRALAERFEYEDDERVRAAGEAARRRGS